MGAGAALFDFDGDGDLDAYLVQGATLEPGAGNSASSGPANDRLFRNELAETGDLRFVDVTADSGIESTGYGMGVAAADYDGDGRTDLYVTNFGPNRLWRNLGGGRFEDATESAAADDPRWSVPTVFFDYDRDGALDLFVANYVDFNLGSHTLCTFGSGEPDYCSPKTYRPEPDRLFRNLGNGRFEQTTDRDGIGAEFGNGLGAVPADFDLDGRLDLYVANDGTSNQLWMNLGAGRFENRALFAGAAVNGRGEAEAGMGVDAGDFDGDGDEDLYVTHITGETSTLYLNNGDGLFTDAGMVAGLDAPSLAMTGFGTGWFDFDNDGDTDVLITSNNGPTRLIVNVLGQDNGWIGLRLLTGDGKRDALGSLVHMVLDDGRTLTRRVRTAMSYASSSDPRVLVGIGAAGVEDVRVTWLGGALESFGPLPQRAYHELRQGQGSR